jgi:hypothetical protein
MDHLQRMISLRRTCVIPRASASFFWLKPKALKIHTLGFLLVGRLFLGSMGSLLSDIEQVQDQTYHRLQIKQDNLQSPLTEMAHCPSRSPSYMEPKSF